MPENLSTCDECGSAFVTSKSQMRHLCPECSHYLYGYKNCSHMMNNGECLICQWDGSTSPYIENLKVSVERLQQRKPE
ncbi:hypothetical protein VMF7928_04308 [Vibrio marisflavi CECT 7928]|uniref:C2H2-type domain-containing protein n=1 Tax=Vibrio marisflavi CECT 7928 TaxID=634439 RepID=A0ABN8EA98_9VIBR|nr:hypothetical protein VMF7928_04308 [Vibrio marisflavi CECT 7928]